MASPVPLLPPASALHVPHTLCAHHCLRRQGLPALSGGKSYLLFRPIQSPVLNKVCVVILAHVDLPLS